MRKRMQKIQGRLFDADDLLNELAIYTGQLRVQEIYAGWRARYPQTWRVRTIIKVCRLEREGSHYGLGYGPDWLGYRVIWHGETIEIKRARPIKEDVQNFLDTEELPYSGKTIAAQRIRDRELLEQALHNVALQATAPAARKRKRANGHQYLAQS